MTYTGVSGAEGEGRQGYALVGTIQSLRSQKDRGSPCWYQYMDIDASRTSSHLSLAVILRYDAFHEVEHAMHTLKRRTSKITDNNGTHLSKMLTSTVDPPRRPLSGSCGAQAVQVPANEGMSKLALYCNERNRCTVPNAACNPATESPKLRLGRTGGPESSPGLRIRNPLIYRKPDSASQTEHIPGGLPRSGLTISGNRVKI